jgi:hypothetical protein
LKLNCDECNNDDPFRCAEDPSGLVEDLSGTVKYTSIQEEDDNFDTIGLDDHIYQPQVHQSQIPQPQVHQQSQIPQPQVHQSQIPQPQVHQQSQIPQHQVPQLVDPDIVDSDFDIGDYSKN